MQESVPVLGSIENLSLPPSLHGQVMEKEVGAEPEEETLDELLRSAENAINETTLVEAVLAGQYGCFFIYYTIIRKLI